MGCGLLVFPSGKNCNACWSRPGTRPSGGRRRPSGSVPACPGRARRGRGRAGWSAVLARASRPRSRRPSTMRRRSPHRPAARPSRRSRTGACWTSWTRRRVPEGGGRPLGPLAARTPRFFATSAAVGHAEPGYRGDPDGPDHRGAPRTAAGARHRPRAREAPRPPRRRPPPRRGDLHLRRAQGLAQCGAGTRMVWHPPDIELGDIAHRTGVAVEYGASTQVQAGQPPEGRVPRRLSHQLARRSTRSWAGPTCCARQPRRGQQDATERRQQRQLHVLLRGSLPCAHRPGYHTSEYWAFHGGLVGIVIGTFVILLAIS